VKFGCPLLKKKEWRKMKERDNFYCLDAYVVCFVLKKPWAILLIFIDKGFLVLFCTSPA
jgi:hypothetical protein